MPLVQLCPAEQARPHMPQLLASVWVVTQVPLQSVCPLGHMRAMQVPAVQVCPAAQALPQAPQLAPSVWVFTHCPAHEV